MLPGTAPRQHPLRIRPDPVLVYEAERAITGANVHLVQKALKWYLHWCEVGNESAALSAAWTLQQEAAKAHPKSKAS